MSSPPEQSKLSRTTPVPETDSIPLSEVEGVTLDRDSQRLALRDVAATLPDGGAASYSQDLPTATELLQTYFDYSASKTLVGPRVSLPLAAVLNRLDVSTGYHLTPNVLLFSDSLSVRNTFESFLGQQEELRQILSETNVPVALLVGPDGMLDSFDAWAINTSFNNPHSGEPIAGLSAFHESDVSLFNIENELRELTASLLLGDRKQTTRQAEALSYTVSTLTQLAADGNLRDTSIHIFGRAYEVYLQAMNSYGDVEQVKESSPEVARIKAGLMNNQLASLGLLGGNTTIHLGITVSDDGTMDLTLQEDPHSFPRYVSGQEDELGPRQNPSEIFPHVG